MRERIEKGGRTWSRPTPPMGSADESKAPSPPPSLGIQPAGDARRGSKAVRECAEAETRIAQAEARTIRLERELREVLDDLIGAVRLPLSREPILRFVARRVATTLGEPDPYPYPYPRPMGER